jgi:hypothetical protein
VLRWWHLLSLDAPTIAALWSWSFARGMHVQLPWTSPLLLALGTWLVYVADRILDGLRSGASNELRERHFLYARHRGIFLAVGALASLTLIWFVATRMNAVTRREDLALFAAALVYFCLIHVWGPKSKAGIQGWFPKEVAVAVVFAAAVAVPAWSRVPAHRASLIPVVTFFALICWLNCVAIDKWEQSHSGPAPAHSTTRWTQRHLLLVSCVIALLAAIGCAISVMSSGPIAMRALYLACLTSAMLFPALDRSRLDSLELRIAADAALLTPLLFIAALQR